MTFKPVYKVGDHGDWQRLAYQADVFVNSFKQVEAQFVFTFEQDNSETPVYFALTFPYSYSDLQNYLDDKERIYKDHPDVYLKRECLTYSYEGLRIDYLTITSNLDDSGKIEDRVHEALFPLQAQSQEQSK